MTVAAWDWLFRTLIRLFPHTRTRTLARTGGEGEDAWEVVYVAANELEAEVVRGHLESEDIPVVLRGEALGRVYGMTVGPLAQVEVLVPVPLAEQARTIVAREENDDSGDEEALSPEDN